MTDNSDYLAKPSGACCLKGNLHEGEARGKIQTISGIETYVSTPASDKANGNILLYFPDVYGLFNNAKLIMDAFADAGYLALGLDYFKGVSIFSKHPINAHIARILSQNIGKIDTIIQTRTLTLMPGWPSIPNLRTR